MCDRLEKNKKNKKDKQESNRTFSLYNLNFCLPIECFLLIELFTNEERINLLLPINLGLFMICLNKKSNGNLNLELSPDTDPDYAGHRFVLLQSIWPDDPMLDFSLSKILNLNKS